MKSKLIAIMIKAVIDLRLLTGYKLVPLDDWISLNVQLSENQTNTQQVKELQDELLQWQDKWSQSTKRVSGLTLERDRLAKDLHETSAKLTESVSEVEIANSEMLILRDSLEEATDLSKQLKEALDRWTS